MKSSNAAGSWAKRKSYGHLLSSGAAVVASRRQTCGALGPGLSSRLIAEQAHPPRMMRTVVLRLGTRGEAIDAITPLLHRARSQARTSPPRLSTAPAQMVFQEGGF